MPHTIKKSKLIKKDGLKLRIYFGMYTSRRFFTYLNKTFHVKQNGKIRTKSTYRAKNA